MPANDRQHGGDHYADMAIAPWDFIEANGIPFLEGSAIKYLCRWRQKGGVEDLRKAIHFIEKRIELEERAAPAAAEPLSADAIRDLLEKGRVRPGDWHAAGDGVRVVRLPDRPADPFWRPGDVTAQAVHDAIRSAARPLRAADIACRLGVAAAAVEPVLRESAAFMPHAPAEGGVGVAWSTKPAACEICGDPACDSPGGKH